MFRKALVLLAAFLLGADAAAASIVGPLPFTLTNGTVADASQVMANFNKIVNDVNNNVIFPVFTQQNYYAVDTGSANNLIVSLSPAPTIYVPGMVVNVKLAASNTGASTININGLGNQGIVNLNGSVLKSQQLLSGAVAQMVYDGTQFELSSLTPLAIRQVAEAKTTTLFSTSGAWTFTVPTGVYTLRIEAWGGGGGGGGGGNAGSAAGGGGGGAYALLNESVSPGDVVSGTIGVGGAAGVGTTGAGGTGGTTTVLLNSTTLATLTGGVGGTNMPTSGASGGGLGGAAVGAPIVIALTGASGGVGVPAAGGGGGGFSPRGGVGGQFNSGGGGNPGGGGGGALGVSSGGAGGVGWVFIEY